MVIAVALHNVLVVSEYYLLLEFNMVLDQNAIDILAETNPVEVENFIQSYFSPTFIFAVVILIVFLNVIIYWGAKWFTRIKLRWIWIVFTVYGVCIIVLCGYNFMMYRNGLFSMAMYSSMTSNLHQYTTITRAGFSMHVVKKRRLQIIKLTETCEKLEVTQSIDRKPTVVVVIGESFSVYHSSLYGYEKQTNPLLSKYMDNGSLFIFDNVVTLADATAGAMRADFSLDSLGVDYVNQPLFPACFKAAHYKTRMYDNQYFVGADVTFLTNEKLSEAIFDFRNTERYKYDGQMIDDMGKIDSTALYVIHLWGQHYTYSNRYPESFKKFKSNDYDNKYSEEQKNIIAHYDNATLYNDFVLDKIIKKFEDQYCVLFYFSDHGEEVFELRNNMGHGTAEHSPNLNYQIRVPLMVWLSPSYYQANTELVDKLKEASHYPICTDDIGHAIIDVAEIKTEKFAPTRSFVNSKYDKKRHRIVLRYIDYDKEWIKRR